MKSLFFIAALLILALLVFAMLKKRGKLGDSNETWPFYAKRPLTLPEQILYHRLVKALPERIVLAQVQVSRVLGVKKGFKFNEWNNRINRLSYDFVVCSKDSTVLAVIELDDSSHDAALRRDTDQKKDTATRSANVQLVRWNVKSLPDQESIQQVFAKLESSVVAKTQ